jgi:hypothetical protein
MPDASDHDAPKRLSTMGEIRTGEERLNSGVPLAAHEQHVEHRTERPELQLVLHALLDARAAIFRRQHVAMDEGSDRKRALAKLEREGAVRLPRGDTLAKPVAVFELAAPLGQKPGALARLDA